MSLNRFFSFIHGDIIMCGVSNERRENALDNEAYTLSVRNFDEILRGNEDISLIKRAFKSKFYWDALYNDG